LKSGCFISTYHRKASAKNERQTRDYETTTKLAENIWTQNGGNEKRGEECGENYSKRVSLFALITKCITAIKPRRISKVGRVACMGAIKNGAQFG
jgi:hypothetical protein